MKRTAFACLAALPFPLLAGKPCEELKSEIEAKLQAKGVAGYTLEITSPSAAENATVVGSCDGGTQRIVYSRGGGPARPGVNPETAAPKPVPTPKAETAAIASPVPAKDSIQATPPAKPEPATADPKSPGPDSAKAK